MLIALVVFFKYLHYISQSNINIGVMDDLAKLGRDRNQQPIQILSIGDYEQLDGTSANVQSTIVDGTHKKEIAVRLAGVSGGSYIKIGENPIAADGEGAYLPESAVEYFRVEPGHKIAVFGGIVNLVKAV